MSVSMIFFFIQDKNNWVVSFIEGFQKGMIFEIIYKS